MKVSSPKLSSQSGNQLTICLIDDEPGIVNALSLLINALGHKVVGFTDPLQALGFLKSAPNSVDFVCIDFVLCDLRMPLLSGRELLMLSLSSAPQLPVVLMSAHADSEQIAQLLQMGAFDFLAKPFSPEQFRVVVQKIYDLKLQMAS